MSDAAEIRGPWESAVVVRVPSLDATLAALRERFDLPRKRNGIPAHITAIVPFLLRRELDPAALAELHAICAELEPFAVSFAETRRFPRVLYLAPEPAERFVELTHALARRWPQLQPYGASHREPVPHLTVTTAGGPAVFDAVAAGLRAQLPLSAWIGAAQLYLFDGRRWEPAETFPFGRPSASKGSF